MTSRRVDAVLVALLSACSSACQRANSAAEHAKDWTIQKNIGPLLIGSNGPRLIEERISVRNPSETEEMVLSTRSQSCGCLEVLVQPISVRPRAECTLTVRLSFPNDTQAGNFIVIFDTALRTPSRLRVELAINMFEALITIPKVLPEISPSGVHGTQAALGIVARRAVYAKDEPVSVTCSNSSIGLELRDEGSQTHDGIIVSKATVRISIPPSMPGQFETSGQAVICVRQGRELIERPLRWRYAWPLYASPSSLFIHADPREKTQKTIQLRADLPFSITGIGCTHEHLHAKAILNQSESLHEIAVTCWPGPARHGSATLTIRTDHAQQREIKIPVEILWKP